MATNVSLKHFLGKSKAGSKIQPVYFRITYNRKKAELHTGFNVMPQDWQSAGERTKNNTTINKELTAQKSKIYDLLSELQKDNKTVSAAILKDLYTGKTVVKARLLEYLDAYIDELKIRGGIKPISLNKYTQSKNTLTAFIKVTYSLADINIERITFDFINSYDLYLKQALNLHKNTINKYHSRLRTILLRAFAEGIITKQPYSNFKLVTVKSDREFVSQEDLNKIIELNLSHNKSLDKVKDLFIFSCYTGLRFQDAQNLSTTNLSLYKNKPVIRFAQEKTGNAIDIPLLPIAKKILDKYKNDPERKILNKLLPKISNQKVNSYLKIIADHAQISSGLSHHMARHTFATTICLNNGMPMEDVSKLLGHSSLKTTQIYGRITRERLQKSMAKINKKI